MNYRNRIPCYICEQTCVMRVMKRINIFQQQKIQLCITHREDLKKPPADINVNSRICINCNNILNAAKEDLEHEQDCLRLNILKKTRNLV